MIKKILAILGLATLTTEAVLSERHHDALPQQAHAEIDTKLPMLTKEIKMSASGGAGPAVSATGVLTANEDSLPAHSHT